MKKRERCAPMQEEKKDIDDFIFSAEPPEKEESER